MTAQKVKHFGHRYVCRYHRGIETVVNHFVRFENNLSKEVVAPDFCVCTTQKILRQQEHDACKSLLCLRS